MKQIPRRTPRELKFVVSESGKTHLLLVEGFSDRTFFRWALGEAASERIAIHSVEEVAVPTEWLPEGASFENNRSLVVAACKAAELESAFGDLSLRGVIDRDCGVPGEWESTSSLLVTDVPAVESFCFTSKTLGKWLLLTLRASDEISGQELIDELSPIVGGLFAVRQHAGTLGARVDKVLSYTNGSWRHRFDHSPSYNEVFSAGSIAAFSHDDRRLICYGHDLAEVLMVRFANRIKNGAGIRTTESLERNLLSNLEHGDIASEPLLVRLVAWSLAQ